MIDLSVIIPTYNSEKHIKDCFDSLKRQDYRNFQVLLADGGSTDNTIQIIKKYKFNLKIVSKKDSSPEEGINKGLKKVNTNFFCILMSDDLMYQKNYFSKLIHILKHNKADVAFPNFGSIVGKKKRFLNQTNNFDRITYKPIVPDIGWVANSKVLKEGHFTKSYKLATSYHFLLRLYKKQYKFQRVKSVNYFFRMGGNSFKDGFLGLKECKNVAISFGGNKYIIYYQFLIDYFKFILKYKIIKFKI